MRRSLRSISGSALAVTCAVAAWLGHVPTVGAQLATGRSEIVVSFAPGNSPEGIAVTRQGELFVGNREIGATTVVNQILRIGTDGSVQVFATLPNSSPGAHGLLGLAVDPAGNLYAARAGFDDNQGVWHVSPDGARIQRVPGSEAITFPNALTFDARGNLYVTDSLRGAIWRAPRGGPFSLFVEDPLLAPLPFDPYGTPLPGANGIAFFPPDILYVANSERSLIARVLIASDGHASAVEAVTAPFAVPIPDGIAMDVHGHIHAVLPAFPLLQTSPLVKIDPATGAVTPTVINPVDMSRFDTPLSLAFGSGPWDARTVLATNGDLQTVPGGPGPGVVQVEVGVAGFPIP